MNNIVNTSRGTLLKPEALCEVAGADNPCPAVLLHQGQCVYCTVEAVDLLVRVAHHNLWLVLNQTKARFFLMGFDKLFLTYCFFFMET